MATGFRNGPGQYLFLETRVLHCSLMYLSFEPVSIVMRRSLSVATLLSSSVEDYDTNPLCHCIPGLPKYSGFLRLQGKQQKWADPKQDPGVPAIKRNLARRRSDLDPF